MNNEDNNKNMRTPMLGKPAEEQTPSTNNSASTVTPLSETANTFKFLSPETWGWSNTTGTPKPAQSDATPISSSSTATTPSSANSNNFKLLSPETWSWNNATDTQPSYSLKTKVAITAAILGVSAGIGYLIYRLAFSANSLDANVSTEAHGHLRAMLERGATALANKVSTNNTLADTDDLENKYSATNAY